MGTYEPEQTALFCRLIAPGQTVFDVGAAAGYYTLLSAQLLGTGGRVVACEPEPKNFRFLRQHVAGNRLQNVTLLPRAVGAESGSARFGGGTGTGTGRLTGAGQLIVAVERLDDLATEQKCSPDFIKIDVEGAELDVLRGGEATIRRSRPTIFLSTHEGDRPGVHAACCELLATWGYDLQPILGEDLARTSEVLCTAR